MAWVVLAGILALVPALLHGHALGTYDEIARFGVTARPGVVPHNSFASDQITEMIPWNNLEWIEVHHGQLPLWNPYSALGMPLAFNWQSAAFALPTLVGYLFPLELSYTTTVVLTLLIAGTGAFVLCRVLGLTVVACAFAGVAYELSGAFFGWLGWPIAGVFSWAGWLMAALVMMAQGRRREVAVPGFAVALAAAVYAGQPDALVILGVTILVFALLLFLGRLIDATPRLALRFGAHLLIATVLGFMLSAPLLLPGVQVANRSIRSVSGSALGSQSGLSLRGLVNIFVGYVGIPAVAFDTIGAIVVVLAVAGILVAGRRTETLCVVGILVVVSLFTFVQPIIQAMNDLPGVHAVRWPRASVLMMLLLAVLAAVGIDAMSKRQTWKLVRNCIVVGFPVAAVAFVLAVVLSAGHDPVVPAMFKNSFTLGFRSRGEVFGAVEVVAGLAVAVLLGYTNADQARLGSLSRPRTATLAGFVFLTASTVSLVAMATPVWASSATPLTRTDAERSLVASVGSGTVGLGAASGSCLAVPGIGMHPNTNLNVGLHEFAVYDPMTPRAYFEAWQRATGQPGGVAYISTFCPVIGSVGAAREFGVGYVLEGGGTPPPLGAVFVRRVQREALYRIPGSGAADLVADVGGEPPQVDALGRTVAVSQPSPRVWHVSVSAVVPSVLRLHLTDTPGWHATIDGRPLALAPLAGVMLEARIPPGRHLVTVTYWPRSFTLGLVLAGLALIVMTVALIASFLRRRGLPPSQL